MFLLVAADTALTAIRSTGRLTIRQYTSIRNFQSVITKLPKGRQSNGILNSYYTFHHPDTIEKVHVRTIALDHAERSEPTSQAKKFDVDKLLRAFDLFEERSQKRERVLEKDFVKTFDAFTQAVENLNSNPEDREENLSNIIVCSTTLLRSCGKLMIDTPPKGRELLAGNLWTFLKEKNIPLDISHYNILLRVLNENDTTFDSQTILQEIKGLNLSPDRITYQRLIQQCCLQGDIESATKLLEEMKDLNMDLNEAIFASLIEGYCKQETPPSITEMFDLMRKNGVEPGSKSYVAAISAQATRMSQDPKASIEEFKKIVDLYDKDEIQFSTNDLVEIISHLGPHRKSFPEVAEFLDRIVPSLSGPITSRYRILCALIRSNQFEKASELYWSQRIDERRLTAGNSGNYYIKALTNFNVPTNFAIEECLKMQERGWNNKAIHLIYYHAAENGHLELVRAALKKLAEEGPIKVQYIWPLIAQAKDLTEVISVLKSDLNPLMDTNDLLDTFSLWIWPRFSDDVTRLFELTKELKYDSNLIMASFLNYSVQENKIAEAIKFIAEAPQELVGDDTSQEDADGQQINNQPRSRVSERGSLLGKLLNHIVDQTKDPELVKKAFNMCLMPNQPMSVRNLSALVRVHLVNNDFEKALAEFLKIAQEHKLTPLRGELMNLCLVNKDPDSLQKIMNAITEIYGETNALFDLAVCCLTCNKLKQAQKIFASPGFRVRPVRVYQTCRSLSRLGKVTVLENFVNLARDMYDINQEYLYQVLIETYDQTSNAKRALNLWNMMQEEEFQPSKRSLFMIASILEKNNLDVPFQKPRLNTIDGVRNNRSSGTNQRASRDQYFDEIGY